MSKRLSLFCSVLLAVTLWSCAQGGSSSASLFASGGTVACDTLPRQVAQFRQYAQKMEEALGTYNDIRVFERDTDMHQWRLVNGWYVPVTIGGETPEYYTRHMDSDRPMMLPTTVQSDPKGLDTDGQSNPYSSIGRQPGSNPEVQWIWVVRQYKIKSPAEDSFPFSPDMAVIGHHPRTGATAYLQYYAPDCPKPGVVVPSPNSANAAQFWSPMDSLIPSFKCERCHVAGPFIHSPWINQVTIGGGSAPDAAPIEPVVPSDPLGPFYYVWSDSGEGFAGWDSALIASKGGGHFRKTGNRCTQCHRIAPTMLGLNQNSTRYHGHLPDSNSLSIRSDSFTTPNYEALYWMPPVDPRQIDFYAGQGDIARKDWRVAYGESAADINLIEADTTGAAWRAAYQKGLVVDVPRPPKQYQRIVVDRPQVDSFAPRQSLWVVDSRMRANTDGELQQWRFFAKDGSSRNVRAAPVVYRRIRNDGSRVEFDVVFVGDPQQPGRGGDWLSIGNRTFHLRQGDYLGVVFTNTGDGSLPASIPYTNDDWAVLKNPDGSTWLRDGSVTYRLATAGAPTVGQRVVFTDAAFRTYSFEFRNRM